MFTKFKIKVPTLAEEQDALWPSFNLMKSMN